MERLARQMADKGAGEKAVAITRGRMCLALKVGRGVHSRLGGGQGCSTLGWAGDKAVALKVGQGARLLHSRWGGGQGCRTQGGAGDKAVALKVGRGTRL